MSAGEDFITSDQLKDELNQASSISNTCISSDIIKVDQNLKEYKRLKSLRQGTCIMLNIINSNITIFNLIKLTNV